jgi:hypothetical protein
MLYIIGHTARTLPFFNFPPAEGLQKLKTDALARCARSWLSKSRERNNDCSMK